MRLHGVRRNLPGILALCCVLPASAQMNGMPGMSMDPSHGHSAPATGGTVQKSNSANKPAAGAEQSLQQSDAQQRSQAGVAPSDPGSLTRDTLHLQEPENASQHTGEDLPAPELLGQANQLPPLALQQFLDWAMGNNPTLKQAAAQRERTGQQARQAALPPNPTVGYSGEHIRGGSYHGGEEGAFVQQTIVLGGKLSLRRDVYREQAKVDAIASDEQRYRVQADVQRAFYRALTAQEVVNVRRTLLTGATESAENAHRLANLGQVDAPDVLQAEVDAEAAKIDLADAERDFLRQYSVLTALCNQPAQPARSLMGDLEQTPNLNADAAVAKLLTESPAVERAQQQIAVAEARLKQARREPVPNLTVEAGEWYSGERLDINKAAGWMGFAQASIELPLWNRNQGATGAAKVDVTRARTEVTRMQLSLREQTEPLAQDYLAARFQADRYRTQMIPRAQRAFELYGFKYQQMAAAYPQVLASQRTLLQLQLAYLHALEKVWLAAIQLQNFNLHGGLRDASVSSTDVQPDSSPGAGE